jgi:hypothetical protein
MQVGDHRPKNCPCTDRKHYVTLRKDARLAYEGIMHGINRSQSYARLLDQLAGQRLMVTHVFRETSGLPTGYTAGDPDQDVWLHVSPLLVVEEEPEESPR